MPKSTVKNIDELIGDRLKVGKRSTRKEHSGSKRKKGKLNQDPLPKVGAKSGSKRGDTKNKGTGKGITNHNKKGKNQFTDKKNPSGGNDEDKKSRGDKMESVQIIKYLIENQGNSPSKVLKNFDRTDLLIEAAKKCIYTCLGGWTKSGDSFKSPNTDIVLTSDSWTLNEDGTMSLCNGFQFDYDWLYNLINSKVITEDIDNDSEMDKDTFSDTLSNASALLRKLSDKEVKKYIINAIKDEDDVDIMNLKEILNEVGINWKFIGAEIDGDRINLIIKVKYSKDGSQDGVVEKKLSVEVKPSADVSETEDTSNTRDEIDLGFDNKSDEESIEGDEDYEKAL